MLFEKPQEKKNKSRIICGVVELLTACLALIIYGIEIAIRLSPEYQANLPDYAKGGIGFMMLGSILLHSPIILILLFAGWHNCTIKTEINNLRFIIEMFLLALAFIFFYFTLFQYYI